MRLLRNPPFRTYPAAEGTKLPGAVHVIRGDSAGGSIKAAGACPLVCLPDNLAVGPSSRAPHQHRRLRLRYWRAEWRDTVRLEDKENLLPPGDAVFSAPDLARAVFAAERGRVLLWASGCWGDLLFLGWAVDALDRAEVAPDRIGIAGPRSATFPLGYLNPEQMARFGAMPRLLGRSQAATLRRLWGAFTSATPGPLAELRDGAEQPLPTLRRESAFYAALLPRLKRRGSRLGLPEVDDALLSALSEREWRSLPDLLRTPPSRARWPTSAVFAMLRVYGEFFIETRLRRWSRSPSAAVECVKQPGRYPLAFRLTARGARILERGMEEAAILPRTQIGGHDVTGAGLWVCATERGAWTMRRA
jgi:hypothetical protein